jgi:hypothetical protein
VINPSRFQLRPFHPDASVSVEDVGVWRTSRAVQVTTNDNDARNRQNTYFKVLCICQNQGGIEKNKQH